MLNIFSAQENTQETEKQCAGAFLESESRADLSDQRDIEHGRFVELDEESRAKPADEADTFIEFIKRLTLDEFLNLDRAWKKDRQESGNGVEPIWYQLYNRDIKGENGIRKKVRNPDAPQGTLSQLAVRLAVFYHGFPIIAGAAFFGVVAALTAFQHQEVIDFFQGIWNYNFKSSELRGWLVSIVEFSFAVYAALLIAFYAVMRIGFVHASRPAQWWLIVKNFVAAIAGAFVGFLVTIAAGGCFDMFNTDAAPQITSIALTGGFGALASIALLLCWNIVARFFLYLSERDENFQIRTAIRSEIVENSFRITRYLERAKQVNPSLASEGLLKQTFMARRQWDYLHFVQLMYDFIGFDVKELGYKETQKLFRRWRWIYLAVAGAIGAIWSIGALDVEKAETLIKLWLGGGLAFLIVSWITMRWAISYSDKKVKAAEAVVKPTLEDADCAIFPLGKKIDHFDWATRYEQDELLNFVLSYQNVLAELDAITHPLNPRKTKSAESNNVGDAVPDHS